MAQVVMDRIKVALKRSEVIPFTNPLSIFTTSTGMLFNENRDEYPTPKSSMAIFTPKLLHLRNHAEGVLLCLCQICLGQLQDNF